MTDSDHPSRPEQQPLVQVLYAKGKPYSDLGPVTNLARMGCAVTVAQAPEVAWRECESNKEPFDIVIAEVDTLDSGGGELIRRLGAIRYRAKIFVLLDSPADNLIEDYESLAVIGLLLRPFDPATLRDQIEAIRLRKGSAPR